jgi:hypothetical protein
LVKSFERMWKGRIRDVLWLSCEASMSSTAIKFGWKKILLLACMGVKLSPLSFLFHSYLYTWYVVIFFHFLCLQMADMQLDRWIDMQMDTQSDRRTSKCRSDWHSGKQTDEWTEGEGRQANERRDGQTDSHMSNSMFNL